MFRKGEILRVKSKSNAHLVEEGWFGFKGQLVEVLANYSNSSVPIKFVAKRKGNCPSSVVGISEGRLERL